MACPDVVAGVTVTAAPASLYPPDQGNQDRPQPGRIPGGPDGAGGCLALLQAARFPSSCTGPGDTGVPWPVGSEALDPSRKSQHELLAGAVAARAISSPA